jgi:hypothetical protein
MTITYALDAQQAKTWIERWGTLYPSALVGEGDLVLLRDREAMLMVLRALDPEPSAERPTEAELWVIANPVPTSLLTSNPNLSGPALERWLGWTWWNACKEVWAQHPQAPVARMKAAAEVLALFWMRWGHRPLDDANYHADGSNAALEMERIMGGTD